jgi:hypothetical protein
MTRTVYHRSTAVDVRNGRAFRWQHHLDEARALVHRDEVNAGRLDGPGFDGGGVHVVAWLDGEDEPRG